VQLSDEQIASFDRDGYLVLRGLVPPALLQRLRNAAERWVAQASEDDADHLYATRDGSRALWRIDYLHAKGEHASLELLGSPEVLGVAESLCGPDFVPTYESMVVKQPGAGAPVAWHQDAVHPRRHRLVNIDVYLDDARIGSGALRVVPGSQVTAHDVCEVADTHGWEPPGFVEVGMSAGDVLLHDVMVLHGSEPTSGSADLRRTLYYEFRPAAHVIEEGPWDASWVEQRQRLVALALRAHAAAFANAPAFAWAPAQAPGPIGDDDTELRVAHTVHTPGSWCSAG
jgi:ectoine hydroxylase-related dioxygenase (phytanoyl-CoA dioxygenase family)